MVDRKPQFVWVCFRTWKIVVFWTLASRSWAIRNASRVVSSPGPVKMCRLVVISGIFKESLPENTRLLCKGMNHWTADLLFDWFGFSCFGYARSTTDTLVLPNPKQSNRSVVQLYSSLQSKWVFSAFTTGRIPWSKVYLHYPKETSQNQISWRKCSLCAICFVYACNAIF